MDNELAYAKVLWGLYIRSTHAGNEKLARDYLDRWYEVCDRLLIELPSRTDNLRIG